jgi:hypothetical protein
MNILPPEYDSAMDNDSAERFARPTFGPPEDARLFDFGAEHNQDGEPIVAPFSDPEFERLAEALPEGHREFRQMRDRPPYSQALDWGLIVGLTSGVLQILGVPGLIQLGKNTRDWLRAKNGRSGDAGALLPVAIFFITEAYPDAQPNPERVQVLDPTTPAGVPRDHQVVFLYRIYDLSERHVYVVEVSSDGQLTSCTRRDIAMFENPRSVEGV